MIREARSLTGTSRLNKIPRASPGKSHGVGKKLGFRVGEDQPQQQVAEHDALQHRQRKTKMRVAAEKEQAREQLRSQGSVAIWAACTSGTFREESASSVRAGCGRAGSGLRSADRRSAASPPTCHAASGKYTRSGSCQSTAPERRSQLQEKVPRSAKCPVCLDLDDYKPDGRGILSTKVTVPLPLASRWE